MPTSRAGISNRTAGFTLVELALVLFLVAAFTGLVLPLTTGLGEDKLRRESRRLAGTVKELFNEASLSGRQHRLTFDLARGSYRASVLEAVGERFEEHPVGRERQLPKSVRLRDVAVAGRDSSGTGTVAATVYPVGWMDEIVIHLEEEGEVFTLRVSPLTGITEVYEGDRQF